MIDACDDTGRTALHSRARILAGGYSDRIWLLRRQHRRSLPWGENKKYARADAILMRLLEHGSNPLVKDDEGNTALFYLSRAHSQYTSRFK